MSEKGCRLSKSESHLFIMRLPLAAIVFVVCLFWRGSHSPPPEGLGVVHSPPLEGLGVVLSNDNINQQKLRSLKIESRFTFKDEAAL